MFVNYIIALKQKHNVMAKSGNMAVYSFVSCISMNDTAFGEQFVVAVTNT